MTTDDPRAEPTTNAGKALMERFCNAEDDEVSQQLLLEEDHPEAEDWDLCKFPLGCGEVNVAIAAIEAESREPLERRVAELEVELEAAAVLLTKVIESMQKNDPAIFGAALPHIHAFLQAYAEEAGR